MLKIWSFKKKNELSSQELHQLQNQSLFKYCNFKITDVLITTPEQLVAIDEVKNINNFNPKYVIIDEADKLFLESNREMKLILNKFKKPNSQFLDDKIKFIISASSFPNEIFKNSIEKYFNSFLQNIKLIESKNYFQINPLVDHQNILDENFSFQLKCKYLLKIIQESEAEKIIIFAQNNDILNINEFLSINNLKVSQNTKFIPEQQCITNICNFKKGINKILVCSDELSRGLQFEFPTLVIQFQCAENIIDLIHRFGRTGKLGQKGKVISFLEQKDLFLLSEFQKNLDNQKNMKNLLDNQNQKNENQLNQKYQMYFLAKIDFFFKIKY